MANHFYHQLNNPRIKKITPSKSNIFALSTKKIVKFNGLDIVTYRWPGKNRKVLTWTIKSELDAKKIRNFCDNITFEGFKPIYKLQGK